MFCSNCGKEIMDSAKFCNFCGIPIRKAEPAPIPNEPENFVPPTIEVPETAAMPPITSEPVSAPADSFDESLPQNTETSDENAESMSEPAAEDTPQSESVTEDTPKTEPAAPTYSAPNPEQIPNYGTAQPSYQPMPQQPPQQAPQRNYMPEPPANRTQPERKYTFTHIMMCLGAVAVMAIVAGIFAGLYFFSA